MKLAALIALALAGCATEPPQITAVSTPALPAANLLDKSGFNEDFSKWAGFDAKDGMAVSAYREDGKHVVAVDTRRSNPALNLGWGQGSFGASQYLKPDSLFVDGQDYILACMAKSGQPGSGYSGFSISFYQPDWKALPWDKQMNALALVNGPTNGQWRRFVSKPFTYRAFGKAPLICSVGVGMVYERGFMAFKELGIYPASARLSLEVKGENLLQVAVEDDAGEQVFASDKFAEGKVDFRMALDVSAAHSYTIKVLGRDGELFVKPYPEGTK